MQAHPTNIGRYQILRPIGQGAMGTVYLAEDPMLKRRLAIKVVRAVGEERDLALERFKREAEVSAQLNHPNIVTIYDVGEEPSVGPFLAMEFVEGHSLGKHLREGDLETEACFGILIQAMRALRSAHRHAIVHRDVKPDNILVGEDGRVKLMDFGIAKTMAPRLTSTGEFLGSPAYSAPELLKGGEPTPSSDRYAFAVTAFELLTGQLPHPGNNVAAVITHVLHDPPAIPPGMSGDVANVFRTALAPDPDDRYETLMEFLTALIDVTFLEEPVRNRVNELFRHDDHAGDIVPLRRTRPRSAASASPLETGRGTAARATGTSRSTSGRPLPGYSTSSNLKIELEDEVGTALPSASVRTTHGERKPPAAESIQPKTLIWWIIFVLIGGQLFWWFYARLNQPGS
jgi:serine/threonine-protein kinase